MRRFRIRAQEPDGRRRESDELTGSINLVLVTESPLENLRCLVQPHEVDAAEQPIVCYSELSKQKEIYVDYENVVRLSSYCRCNCCSDVLKIIRAGTIPLGRFR
jgi:hypothetical protein